MDADVDNNPGPVVSDSAGDRYPPISSYALIGDCHSVGLVSRAGSVDWACFRRVDAPSSFARLLDWERGGFCSLVPVSPEPAGRRYLEGTMVLETDHRSGEALGRTTDLFAVAPSSHPGEARRVHPHHQLLRIAEGIEGAADWEFVCRPRFEYGIVEPRATLHDQGLAVLVGGPEALSVAASVPLEVAEGEVRARFRLGAGEKARFSLTWHRAHEVQPEPISDETIDHRLAHTCGYWREWAEMCSYDGPYRAELLRSALTLKTLTNAPTGALAAAATTSLPEEIGGTRNWDYRFCWVRDSAFTLYAMGLLGYRSEARAYLGWLARTTAGQADALQVLYGVGGERFLPEATLDHLEGYRGSRPVRVGNGAAEQFQLDVYGEIIDTAHLWHRSGGPIEPEFWEFLRRCVDCIEARWREPDEGIWEIRGGRRHFVHSKVMCWVGVDRALKIAEGGEFDAPADEWRALRDEIRADVLDRGYDEEVGAFVQAYDSKYLDASVLLLPLVHFIKADDPRMRSTVEAIQRDLTRDGLVYRYRTEDGLPGGEGTFVICSFWLLDNLALQGRVEEARELFERLCGMANDVGLLSEEVDPVTGEPLGNFPQGYTHVALINAAFQLQRAERRRGRKRSRQSTLGS